MITNTSDSAFVEVIRRIGIKLRETGHPGQLERVDPSAPFEKVRLDGSTLSTEAFAVKYFEQKLLSKWKGWKVKGTTPKAEAIVRWEADEAQNLLTNRRLRALKENTGFPGGDLITIISMAQGLISHVLGDFSYRKVLGQCRWGPGATWDYPNGTCRGQKISGKMSTTVECQEIMKLLIESDPNWVEAVTGFYPSGPVSLTKDFWLITDASRFTTVPKDWDVDRGIDMQPTANGYLQQGVGQYLRSRLKYFGIDLDSQEENQLGAFYAYYAGLATLDLKAASDSVTSELVSLLLPIEWSEYLVRLRTKYTQFGHRGAKVKTEKFSAMGNAFTFELETLIFWALAKASSRFEDVPDDSVLVYGDDIVCDARAYDRLVYVLNYCGFRVNLDKSFRSGPFYESCGKHYHTGVDVTPVYQKSVVNSPEECIRFHNRLVRWSERIYGDPWFLDEALMLLQALYFDLSNEYCRERGLPRVPVGAVNDDGFLSDEGFFKRDVNNGFYTLVLRPRRKEVPYANEAAYLQLKLNASYKSNVDHQDPLLGSAMRRRPLLLNTDPKGYVSEAVGRPKYFLSRSYFYS